MPGVAAKSSPAADLRNLAAAVLDASDDSMIALSIDRTLLSWNRGAERIYGYTAKEAIGQKLSFIIPPAERDAAQKDWERVVAGERLASVDYTRQTKDGRTIMVSVTLSPILDSAGAVTGVAAIARDITEQKRTQTAIADAHARTLEASRLKSEFIANMNHELRTPMNGVLGISDLLADTPLNDEQRELLGTLRASGETMMAVVNDVLDFAKIEAAEIRIADAPFDIRELAEEVCSIIAATPTSRVDLTTCFDDGLPQQLLGDRDRIGQILINLVSNAVKFTAAGMITVRASWPKSTSDDDELLVEVTDTGPGIEEQTQDLIFRAFAQADGSMTRRHGGTGLGLTIAKDLVELMGGEIGVRSALGEGSTFWFSLPLREAPPEALVLSQPSLEEARVLVVDGNAATRSVLEGQLRVLRIMVGTAPGQDTMLEALRGAARAGRPYDIALVDPGSSHIDGEELQRILNTDRSLPAVRLVLLTDDSAEPARTIASFASCVVKPLSAPALYNVVLDALDAEPSERAFSPDPVGQTPAPRIMRRVLVAEDDPVNQLVVVRMLEKRGYDVDAADTGRKAVEMHTQAPYDLILMDCQLTHVDGYEATREIRQLDADARHTPIIAVTADTRPGNRERCLAAGMDFYRTKPLSAAGLDEVIAEALRLLVAIPAGTSAG